MMAALKALFVSPVHWSARLLVPVLLLVVGLVAIHYLGRLQALFGGSGLDAAVAGAHEIHQTVGANQATIAKLRHAQLLHDRAQQAQTDTAARWRDSALALTAVIEGVATEKEQAARPDTAQGRTWADVALYWRRADVADAKAVSECTLAKLDCEARALVDSARLDSVTALLTPLVHAADCHWLGVGFLPKCWSRFQSYAAGAGTVFVIELLTGHIKL